MGVKRFNIDDVVLYTSRRGVTIHCQVVDIVHMNGERDNYGFKMLGTVYVIKALDGTRKFIGLKPTLKGVEYPDCNVCGGHFLREIGCKALNIEEVFNMLQN